MAKRFGLSTRIDRDRNGRINYYLGVLLGSFITTTIAMRHEIDYSTVLTFAVIFVVMETIGRVGAVLISKLHDRHLIRKANKKVVKK